VPDLLRLFNKRACSSAYNVFGKSSLHQPAPTSISYGMDGRTPGVESRGHASATDDSETLLSTMIDFKILSIYMKRDSHRSAANNRHIIKHREKNIHKYMTVTI